MSFLGFRRREGVWSKSAGRRVRNGRVRARSGRGPGSTASKCQLAARGLTGAISPDPRRRAACGTDGGSGGSATARQRAGECAGGGRARGLGQPWPRQQSSNGTEAPVPSRGQAHCEPTATVTSLQTSGRAGPSFFKAGWKWQLVRRGLGDGLEASFAELALCVVSESRPCKMSFADYYWAWGAIEPRIFGGILQR